MALFANDTCGQPVPWEHCCPWMYFEGKHFQSKLLKASWEKTPLIDFWDGQDEPAAKVEKVWHSLLGGLNFPGQSLSLPFLTPLVLPFYPTSVCLRNFSPVPPAAQGQGQGLQESVALEALMGKLARACLPHGDGSRTLWSLLTQALAAAGLASCRVESNPYLLRKLEIASIMAGHWAGSRWGCGGRGPFPLQVFLSKDQQEGI